MIQNESNKKERLIEIKTSFSFYKQIRIGVHVKSKMKEVFNLKSLLGINIYDVASMIPPQVHLRRPCYDFSFL